MPRSSVPSSSSSAFDEFAFAGTPDGQRALRRFQNARTLTVFWVVLAAVSATRATTPYQDLYLAGCLGLLSLAVVTELFARAKLMRSLVLEATRSGLSPATAAHHVETFWGRILDLHLPTHGEGGLPEITLTALDRERISALLQTQPRSYGVDLAPLGRELARASIVAPDAVAADVVTMNSRVCFEDEASGVRREITLVYPPEADPSCARVSILSPEGSALLGLRVGQAIDWTFPRACRRRLRVYAVPYQPEASGHFHL